MGGSECLGAEPGILSLSSRKAPPACLLTATGSQFTCPKQPCMTKEGRKEMERSRDRLRVKRNEVLLFFVTFCFSLDDVCYVHN